jgi:hypothetical protein
MIMRQCWRSGAVAAALGTGLLGPGAAAGAAAPGAAAPTASQVAIVISGHGAYCVGAGGTGDSILNSVASVAYRSSDHLIVQIDGVPSPAFADDTHYWAYWHDTSGTWQYSSSGAGSYRPAAGTVEGWSYNDGRQQAAPPPAEPRGLFASICAPKPAPATTTTAQRRRPPSAAGSRSVAGPASPTPVAPANAGVHRSRAHESATAVRSSQSSTGPATAAVIPDPSLSGRPSASLVKATARGAGGPPRAAVVGIVLVALLGAGGGWSALRRRRAG